MCKGKEDCRIYSISCPPPCHKKPFHNSIDDYAVRNNATTQKMHQPKLKERAASLANAITQREIRPTIKEGRKKGGE